MHAHGNFLEGLPNAQEAEVFEALVKTDGVTIERIVSHGQRSAPGQWYEQAQNEWVMLLRGAACIRWDDGSELALTEGDYVLIPALKRHRVEWTDPKQDTVWLAMHFAGALRK